MIGRMQKRALAVILALVMVFGQTLTGVLTLTAEAASVDLTNYYVNDVANASDSDTRNGITLTVYDTVNCMPYANYCLGYTGLNGLYIGSALGGEDTAFRATFTTGSVFSAASLSISTYATTSNITIKGYNSVGTPVGDGVTLTSVNSGERRIADLSADGDFSSISTLEISSSNSDFMIYSLDIGSANTAPTATDVSVGGTAKVGQTLTGSYTYGDADSDTESGSIYKWYRATDASGTGAAAISGATSNTYDLTSDDLGKYVCFEVTPSDGTDSGTAVKSSYTGPVAAAPDTTAPTVTDKTIAASDLTATGVTLSWNKATDDTSAQTALEYLVYQSSSDNLDTVEHIEANGAAVGSYAADIATKDVTDLTTGTTYYFNVIVKDEAGNKTCYTANSVTTEVGLELGAAVFTGGKYSYPNAEVSGSGIKTLLISFSKSTADGDEIVLPTAPAGFTVSSTSNDYTKRINLDDGILTSTVQEYLRGIGFAIASATQTVSITITTESITADTFYYAATEHYYQFIPAGESGVTWTDAYTAAEGMSYMGRTGYLATVMSLGEDTFLNSLSDGSTGWLGGTILMNSGIRVDADGAAAADGRYYSLFTTTSFVSDGWYWACGPEIGTIFYNVNSINLVDGTNEAEKASNADADNPDTYYNWSRTGACEPNNTSGGENCLTTLMISGRTGSQGTSFTWNDIAYNNTDQSSDFSAKGYFVEYGNLLTGDNGSGSAAFASASGDLVFVSSDATLKTSSTIKGETVSLGTPAGTLGSETAGSV
nr:hypothetical protein [Oscillospiraceae bacterium]